MSTEAPARTAQQVFISYRRQETAAHAGRIYDAMVSRYGESNVFMDVDMDPGVDFVEQITEAVSGCVALIVVMGPAWATVEGEDGSPRIEDPTDFVRLEVETGLRRDDVKVIPALVAGARMPRQEALPEALAPIARRNALELSDGRWGYDVGRLLTALDELLPGTGEEEVALNPQPLPPEPPPEARSWWLVLEGALVAAVAAAIGRALGALIEVEASGHPNSGETGHEIATVVLRRTETAALVGLSLAIWLGLRLARSGRFVPWLRGLAFGALGGALGGAFFALIVFLPAENLSTDMRRVVDLGATAITGGFLGALIGSIWRPRRVGLALLSGAAGGFLFQLIVVVAKLDSTHTARVVLNFALGAAAIAGVALAVMLALDRESRGGGR